MNVANLTGLDYRFDLHYLHLHLDHISDISPIANLANLTVLYLQINQMSDTGPLVWNEGPDTADLLNVQVIPLRPDFINIYIPQLEARGVLVDHQESDRAGTTMQTPVLVYQLSDLR